MKDPTPGTWRIRVGSTSPHSIRITGLSTTDFAAGFSKYPTREFSTTTLRPIQGVLILGLFITDLCLVEDRIFKFSCA